MLDFERKYYDAMTTDHKKPMPVTLEEVLGSSRLCVDITQVKEIWTADVRRSVLQEIEREVLVLRENVRPQLFKMTPLNETLARGYETACDKILAKLAHMLVEAQGAEVGP